MQLPKIGLVICNSGASNTGYLTGLAALKIINEFDNEVGICSLPALANRVPKQTTLVKSLEHLIVVDGCRNECAKKILDSLGIKYNAYLNLEHDLGIKKLGPFTTLEYFETDVNKIFSAMAERIKEMV